MIEMVELYDLPGTVERLKMLCRRFLREHPEEKGCCVRVQRTLSDLQAAWIRKEDFDFITLWALGRATKLIPDPTVVTPSQWDLFLRRGILRLRPDASGLRSGSTCLASRRVRLTIRPGRIESH